MYNASLFESSKMKIRINITRDQQELPEEMLTKNVSFIQFLFTLHPDDKLPHPSMYFNLWDTYPFIYLKPKKGTLSDDAHASTCIGRYRESPPPEA